MIRVLNIVSVHDKPHGGHYYTALVINGALLKKNGYLVKLLVVGNEKPEWIEEYNAIFISFNGVNILQVLYSLKDYSSKYDIIHAYDEFAYFFARYISVGNSRLFYTRCGGKNPENRYFPKVDNLICLSRENVEFFEDSEKITSLMYLPNRVEEFVPNETKIVQLRELLELPPHPHVPVVLRICRIDDYYLRSIEQTVALSRELNLHGIEARPLLIGKVYDYDLLNKLRKKYPQLIIITESLYADNAKSILGIADIIVGTGRSLMEAACIGKIVCCPTSNEYLPELIDSECIEHFFKLNFSERGLAQKTVNENLSKIIHIQNSKQKKDEYTKWIKEYSKVNFFANAAIEKLCSLYIEVDGTKQCFKHNLGDFFRQLIRVLSVFVRFTLRKKYENSSYN